MIFFISGADNVTDHLWKYLRLKAKSEKELKEKYRKVFIETYVKDSSGNEIKLYDWAGTRVRFNPRSFDHAFSESSDYRFGDGSHDLPFSKKRARCVLWIKEALTADEGTIEVRNQYRKGSRGRQTKRRVLLVVEEQYVIVLQYRENTGDLQFITAFVANRGAVEKIKRDGGWIETKKPQS